MTIRKVLHSLRQRPADHLIGRWHWKSSLLSSTFRALVFFGANLSAGWEAAGWAMLAEFLYRALMAGFYGSLTQTFRKVEPAWHGRLAVTLLLPLVSHSVELALHWIRGTPNLWISVAASVSFTVASTQFHFQAMRRGVFVVGEGSRSLLEDFRSVPAVLLDLLAAMCARRRCA